MTNLLLWIGQVVLALGFLAFGYTHAFGFERASTRPRTAWMADVGRDNLRIIGILEILELSASSCRPPRACSRG